MFAADDEPFLADVGAVVAVFVADVNVVAGGLPIERLRLGKAGERGVFRGGLDLQGELSLSGWGAVSSSASITRKPRCSPSGAVDGELVHGFFGDR